MRFWYAHLKRDYIHPVDQNLLVDAVAGGRAIEASVKVYEQAGGKSTIFASNAVQHRGTGISSTQYSQLLISRRYSDRQTNKDKFFSIDLAAAAVGPLVESLLALALTSTMMRASLKNVLKKDSMVAMLATYYEALMHEGDALLFEGADDKSQPVPRYLAFGKEIGKLLLVHPAKKRLQNRLDPTSPEF